MKKIIALLFALMLCVGSVACTAKPAEATVVSGVEDGILTVAMECDYAGHTIPIIDPSTGEIRAAQIYVAVLSASQLTFDYASFSQKLPDWIEANQRAFSL